MKVFQIFYSLFLALIPVLGYYARKIYKNNNEKNRKRYRVLKIILYFYVIGFIVFVFYHKCSFFAEKKAILKLSNYCFDFGSIKKDSIYEGNVIITNLGNAFLVIEKMNPGCGCTTVNLSKKLILPKDTCKLSFLYDTRNKTGKQENFITIIANTDSLVHLLQIKAYVH